MLPYCRMCSHIFHCPPESCELDLTVHILLQCLWYKEDTEDGTANANTADDDKNDKHAQSAQQNMEHLDHNEALQPVPCMADTSYCFLIIFISPSKAHMLPLGIAGRT